MQEPHLVKSTSFCSSSLILYHLFIPSLLFLLVLLVSALRQAWTEVLRRDEGCCCPLVVLSTLCPMTFQSDPRWQHGLLLHGRREDFTKYIEKTQKPEENHPKRSQIGSPMSVTVVILSALEFQKTANGRKGGKSVTKIIITDQLNQPLFWYNLLARVG